MKYRVTLCIDIPTYYEIELEAKDEDEAEKLAKDQLADTSGGFYIWGGEGGDIHLSEVTPLDGDEEADNNAA